MNSMLPPSGSTASVLQHPARSNPSGRSRSGDTSGFPVAESHALGDGQQQEEWTGLGATPLKRHCLSRDGGEKLHDNRFLRLLKYLLKAGYMEDWQYGRTLSGTPQGGVVSRILANMST